jgi:hypothetical protein
MDVASPLRAGTVAQSTGSHGSAAWFGWNDLATKFFPVIGDDPVRPRGRYRPMALGEGTLT